MITGKVTAGMDGTMGAGNIIISYMPGFGTLNGRNFKETKLIRIKNKLRSEIFVCFRQTF